LKINKKGYGMKKSYLVKSLVVLGLLTSVAVANDIETNDDDGKDMEIRSSVQIGEKASEADEVKAAKISAGEVITILKAKFPGTITKIELENEDGNLIYEGEVFQNDGKAIDIVIDAGSGKILTSSVDKPDHEEDDDDKKGKEKED